MQKKSLAVLAYMNVHKEEKQNIFTPDSFNPLAVPVEPLEVCLKELEREGYIEIDTQWIQPVYSLIK